MQRRFRTRPQQPLRLPIKRRLDPFSDFLVIGSIIGAGGRSAAIGGGGGGGGGGSVSSHLIFFFFFLADGGGLGESGEPWVLQEHGVGWAEFGDFVEAGADEVARYGGVAFGGEVGWVAVDDCLGGC